MTILEFNEATQFIGDKVKITKTNGKVIEAYLVSMMSEIQDDGYRGGASLDYDFDTPTPSGFGDNYVMMDDVKSVELLETVK